MKPASQDSILKLLAIWTMRGRRISVQEDKLFLKGDDDVLGKLAENQPLAET